MTEPKTTVWEMSCTGRDRDRKNKRRLRAWMFAWMATWLGILAAVKFELLPPGPEASLAAIASGMIGVIAIGAYRRFLLEADELLRKIQLEALAAAVGVGVLGGMTSWLLVRTGALASVDALWLVTAMLFAQAFFAFLGHRRYA
ncbi:MAG: hypothetical protein KDD47_20335 [Acidobacteria bacterium]|nr:hypothetical protein [Acidobacteriota bacterium]